MNGLGNDGSAEGVRSRWIEGVGAANTIRRGVTGAPTPVRCAVRLQGTGCPHYLSLQAPIVRKCRSLLHVAEGLFRMLVQVRIRGCRSLLCQIQAHNYG